MGLIGGPVEVHDTAFIDAPLADFFVTERSRDLYAIRWLESGDFAAGLTRTLSAYVRLHEGGRGELSRALGLPFDFSPATLVLVSDRMDDDWIRVVSTLKIPVMLLRAHSLVDGTRHSAGCLFERCFFTRGTGERANISSGPGPADLSHGAVPLRAQAEGIRPTDPAPRAIGAGFAVETAPDDRPVRLQETPAAERLRSVAETDEEELPSASAPEEEARESPASGSEPASESGSPETVTPGDRIESMEEVEPRSPGDTGFRPSPGEPADAESPPSDGEEDPSHLLSEEERATFRLLENVLESTR